MPNLRIISNNATDRATITGSAAASVSMGLDNLKTDIKSDVLRVTGTTAQIILTWANSEQVSAAILPFTNLQPGDTMRVRGYATAGGTLVFDTGAVSCCPGQAPTLPNWTDQGAGSNAFSYAGGMYARVWAGGSWSVKQVIIDISSPNNPAGYLDFARAVVGNHWEAQNPSVWGVPLEAIDLSENKRLGSGDVISVIKAKYRKQSIELQDLTNADRQNLWNILRGNGTSIPVLVSQYPNSSNAMLEQQHMIYGRLVDLTPLATPNLNRYNSTLNQEEA